MFATSLTDASAAALTWVVQNLVRPGDAVHLAHVVPTIHAREEVYHSKCFVNDTLNPQSIVDLQCYAI